MTSSAIVRRRRNTCIGPSVSIRASIPSTPRSRPRRYPGWDDDRADLRHTRGPLIAVAVVGLLAAALPALSHPLGNFSIDHYSRFRVTPQELRLRYVIDMAEIPTFQELLDIDLNRDRQISTDERLAYLE